MATLLLMARDSIASTYDLLASRSTALQEGLGEFILVD
jgi:hypothetical protein